MIAKSEEFLKEEDKFKDIQTIRMYKLHSSIVHLGKSAGAGHYVCYCKKGNDWIYFNDRKVCVSESPDIAKGFAFIFRRQELK